MDDSGSLNFDGLNFEDQKQHLLQKLVQLRPDQIARLPETIKVQLLQLFGR